MQTAVRGRWYRLLIQADVFAVLLMNELKTLTNVVIWILDKLVHKQSRSHDFLFYLINNSIIIVQVRYFTIETKEVARIGYNGFLLPHSYSGDGRGITQAVLHLSTHAGKKPAISNTGPFLCFNSTVSYMYANHMFSQPIRYARACNFYAHLWHIYSATSNQVIMATMTSTL